MFCSVLLFLFLFGLLNSEIYSSLWYADFSKSSFSNSQLKYEEWAFSSFRRPASMSLRPSMHPSECLWMFSYSSSSSSLPCWRSAPVAACVMCTTSCPCYQQCDFFLYSMHPLHPSLPTTPLPTVPLSSFIHPSIHPSIHPFMHQTSPINPPTGDYVMCRGAYRHPGLSRQPPSAGGQRWVTSVPDVWGSPSLTHSFFSFSVSFIFKFVNLLAKSERFLRSLTFFFLLLWRPPEVGNGVGSAEELYVDNGYDYYTNRGISQWLGPCESAHIIPVQVGVKSVPLLCPADQLTNCCTWRRRHPPSCFCVHCVNSFACQTYCIAWDFTHFLSAEYAKSVASSPTPKCPRGPSELPIPASF